MKSILTRINKTLLALALMVSVSFSAGAWNLQDLLGQAGAALSNNNSSDVLSTIDALFSNGNFEVNQLQGTWEVTGCAVAMKSENVLSQIGGKAATAAIQNKLNPYFKKYGLTGSKLTFDDKGNFVLKLKRMSINGSVEKVKAGEFKTTFKTFGNTTLAPMDTYFERGVTGQTLSIMFDSSRAMQFLQGFASYVKIGYASTISSMLSQYEDMYVGFQLNKVK